MFRVTSDPARNRLYIILAGHLEGPERQAAIKAIMAEAARLAPGFGVITDISALHASDQDGFKDLLRAKSSLKIKGVGPILRIVKLPISRIQVERVSEEGGYHSECVNSLEEADRRLDELMAGTKPAG
jgi:hypothetical protein